MKTISTGCWAILIGLCASQIISIFAGELDFEPALLRMQAFSKLLVDKFMPESPKQRALLAQPWKLIKERDYANGEFELLQLLALDADYDFGAGKNLENVNKFVANVCAIIRQYVVHDWSDGKHMRFHDYMPIFENLDKMDNIIKKQGAKMAKDKYKKFDPKSHTVNSLQAQTIYGVLGTSRLSNKKVLERKEQITKFMLDEYKAKVFEHPWDFPVDMAKNEFEDAVSKIFNELANQCGYTDAKNKCPEKNEACKEKLNTKLLQIYASIYQTIRQQPLSNKMWTMEKYELVYERLHKVEERYKKNPAWKDMLESSYDRFKASYKDSFWGWMFADEEYIKKSLAQKMKEKNAVAEPISGYGQPSQGAEEAGPKSSGRVQGYLEGLKAKLPGVPGKGILEKLRANLPGVPVKGVFERMKAKFNQADELNLVHDD